MRNWNALVRLRVRFYRRLPSVASAIRHLILCSCRTRILVPVPCICGQRGTTSCEPCDARLPIAADACLIRLAYARLSNQIAACKSPKIPEAVCPRNEEKGTMTSVPSRCCRNNVECRSSRAARNNQASTAAEHTCANITITSVVLGLLLWQQLRGASCQDAHPLRLHSFYRRSL